MKIRNNNIIILIVIFVLFINCILSEFVFNGHTYTLSPETMTFANAKTYCESLIPNGNKGYLATVTSEEEFNYITTSILAPGSTTAWISGSDSVSQGKWKFISGPESGQSLYNVYNDRCDNYCPWQSTEPNFIAGESGLKIFKDTVQSKFYFYNAALTDNEKALCEFAQSPISYVGPSSDTGDVTITNLKNFNLQNLVATFQNVDGYGIKFNCTIFERNDPPAPTGTGSVKCSIPWPGYGRYTVTIQDGSGKIDTYLGWQYPPPIVTTVNIPPTLASSNLVTITGNNFGNSVDRIEVFFSFNQAVSCVNVTSLPSIPYYNSQFLTCQLSANIPTGKGVLPIKISVGKVVSINFRTAFIYNNVYYSGFPQLGTYTVSTSLASQLTVDGLVGRLSVIETKEKFDFLSSFLPISHGYLTVNWVVWSPLSYNSSGYYYVSGPKQGQKVTPYYVSITGAPATTSNFGIQLSVGNYKVYNPTDVNIIGAVMEYGGVAPSFKSNSTVMIGTDGGIAEFPMANFGTIYSVITVQMGLNIIAFTKDYSDQDIDATIPAGYGGPFSITVIVDGLPTAPNSSFVKYSPPEITDADACPTPGGLITIKGKNFYINPSLLIVKVGSNSCTGVEIVSNHTVLRCTLPAGYGTSTMTVSLNGVVSAGYTYKYQLPQISYTNSISPLGGLLVITGSNFYITNTYIKVYVTGVLLSGCTITTPHTVIQCPNLFAAQGNHSMSIIVAGLGSSSYIIQYQPPTITQIVQVEDFLEFYGNNFGNNIANLTIGIGSISLTGSCTGNNTYTNCKPIPWNAVSDYITINGSSKYITPIQWYFTPYISSLSSTLVNTTGDIVTISGRYFEQSAFGLPVPLVVIDNGQVNNQTGYRTNSILAYQVLPGTGTNIAIQVKSNLQTSNIALFSFHKPTITSISQTNNTITIIGSNFGQVLSKINILMSNYGVLNTTLTVPHYELVFIPQDQTVNGDIVLTVDSQVATYPGLKLKPYITAIGSPPVSGGVVTLTGLFLSNIDANGQSTNIQFFFNDQDTTCTLKSKPSPYVYECTVAPGTGSIQSFVVNSEKFSDIFSLTYQPPTVNTISNAFYKVAGNVTIKGTNFASTNLSISIGNSSCTSPSVIDSSTIICHFTALEDPQQTPIRVTVTVDGLTGHNDIFQYFELQLQSIEQLQDRLVLTGTNFGPLSSLHIALGAVDITSTCLANGSNSIVCGPLPNQVVSGQLYIDDGATVPIPSLPIVLYPFISTISNLNLPTSGQQVTILGRFFELSTNNITNNITILDNGVSISSSNFQQNGSTTIVYFIPAGTGLNYTILVQVDNRQSNSFLYSYYAPTIVSLVQGVDVLTIIGTSFGTEPSNVQVTYQGLNKPLVVLSITDTNLRVRLTPDLKNGNLSVTVSSQQTHSQWVYLKPQIQSILPNPLTTGGNVTLTGSYFSPTDSNGDDVVININSTIPTNHQLTCRYISKLYPYQIECVQEPGHGYLTYLAHYGLPATLSDPYKSQYHAPVIQYSTSLFYNQMGYVTLTGQSFTTDNFTITIGGKQCQQPTYIDTTHLSCYFSSDVQANGASLPVQVTAYNLTGTNHVFMYYTNKTCANSCSSKGVCNPIDGQCDCTTGYSSLDCSIAVDDKTPVTPPPSYDSSATSTIATGYPTNKLELLLKYFREIQKSGSTVKLYNISNFTWVERNTISQTSTYFKATYKQIILEITISLYPNPNTAKFAGVTLNVAGNSLKYQITITNWPFESQTNTLQVIFDNQAIPSDLFGCGDDQNQTVKTSFTYGGGSQSIWYQIRTGSADFNALFADRMILDQTVVPSQLLVLDSTDQLYQNVDQPELYHLLASIQVPYFSKSVQLDPIFNSASRSENENCQANQNDDDTDSKKKETWKLAVGLTVGLVGGLALILTSIYLIKKKLSNNASKLRHLSNNSHN
ncbi:IPT/TIG domain-containing protein [Tieghemostelium lacteum]|uniref:IPT/TIG domain-containing protein n=1 Tax=Tieghemostelium lacteum TaxID=361077 RepID=A0A151ZGS3_TIELA|nr:IPT/TIG domain-containing protein [Tieghemostelium lacteum]|eukprot:KYQ93172.1 IPT/TIG domain-containing protein [Tieghemostelium lacteum]